MKLSVRHAALAAFTVLTFLAAIPFARPASAGGTSVAVSAGIIPVGGTGTITLQVRNAPAIGISAWRIDIGYTSSASSIASCAPGGGGICNTSFGPSTIRVNGASAGGLGGSTIVLATITVRCGQQTGSDTYSPSIGVLSDATIGNPQHIDASVQSGTVTCVVPPPTQPPPRPTNTPPPPPPPPPPGPTATPVPGRPGGGTTSVAPTRGPTTARSTPGGPTPTGEQPTGTATAEATPTATLASGVLGSAKPPTPAPSPKAVVGKLTLPAASVRPEASSAVLAPDKLSTNPKVIGTNILLAIILMLTLFFVSTLFNGVMDENRSRIEGYLSRALGPLERLVGGAQRSWKAFAGSLAWMEWAVAPAAILGVTGFIYSFSDPSWGFNAKSLVLFLAVIAAAGITTLIAEGGEALMHRTRHKTHAGVRMFPTAIVIAIVFVAICRLVSFQAPVMFGFVAAAAILVPASLDHKQAAFAIFVPATILLAASLGAWALVGPLRDASNESRHWYNVLPGETSAMVFAAGIEGLVFTMIPIEFLDGRKIIRWNPLAWAFLLGVPTFIFAWAILNPAAQGFDALVERRVITALAFTGAVAATAVLFWMFFYLTKRQEEAAEAIA